MEAPGEDFGSWEPVFGSYSEQVWAQPWQLSGHWGTEGEKGGLGRRFLSSFDCICIFQRASVLGFLHLYTQAGLVKENSRTGKKKIFGHTDEQT